MARAFAEIDPKYFVATTFAGRKKAWENALKYSSTALLKDIGGFDTVSGQNTVDWLTKTEYEGKDKVLKFFTDSQLLDWQQQPFEERFSLYGYSYGNIQDVQRTTNLLPCTLL